MAEGRARFTPEICRVAEASPGDYPAGMGVLVGQVMPGRLAWEVLWAEAEAGVMPPPSAFSMRVGSWEFAAVLFSRSGSGEAELILWADPRVGPAQIFNCVEACLTLAARSGFRTVRARAQDRVFMALEAAGFGERGERSWMKKWLRTTR